MIVPAAKALDRILGGAALAALRPARALEDILSADAEAGPFRVREMVAVKFWGVGNAALLLPVLHALRERYAAARLTVVTLSGNETVYRGAADRILTVRPRPLTAMGADLVRAVAVLRRADVDLALDFEHYVRTSQVLLYLARAKHVIAFDAGRPDRACLANVRVPYRDDRHAAESFLDLARAAGVRAERYTPGGLEVDGHAAARAARWCRRNKVPPRPLVVIHPGSGDNFPGRRWPTRRFGLVARRIVDESGACVAVTGSRRERALAAEVVEASGRPLYDLSGRLELDDLVALLSRAELVIANDTGPVHLASALGIPVLGLYGPNTPLLYGPLSAESRAFYDAPPCSPCITNLNYKTSRCLNPVCIGAIPQERVAEAALARLASRRAEKSA